MTDRAPSTAEPQLVAADPKKWATPLVVCLTINVSWCLYCFFAVPIFAARWADAGTQLGGLAQWSVDYAGWLKSAGTVVDPLALGLIVLVLFVPAFRKIRHWLLWTIAILELGVVAFVLTAILRQIR